MITIGIPKSEKMPDKNISKEHNLFLKEMINEIKNNGNLKDDFNKKYKSFDKESYQKKYIEEKTNIKIKKSKKAFIIEKCQYKETNIKTFDGECVYKDNYLFFIMKITDGNLESETVGGGHQGNVKNEIISTIKTAIYYIKKENKEKFVFVLDGQFWHKSMINSILKRTNYDKYNNIIVGCTPKIIKKIEEMDNKNGK